MSVKHKFYFLLGAIFVSVLSLDIYSAFYVFPSMGNDTTVVIIPPHSHLKSIARELKNKGVLDETLKFRILGRLLRVERKLKPGEYSFPFPSSPYDALKILAAGKVLRHKVTFPEGTTMTEMGNILVGNNLVNEKQFFSELRNAALLKKLQIPANTFEGFLFPDTYYFTKNDSTDTILEKMVDRFRSEITPERFKKAQDLNLSLLQWVTLASIIEKESGVVFEQPIISSVFHNRLRKKMRLQSDPTVIYGIPNYDGNIRKVDLLTPTPYNTYTRGGLPLGPIANPGKTALLAAIEPAQTDFFYFVAKRDGTHIFAKTYEEHAQNVRKFQLRR